VVGADEEVASPVRVFVLDDHAMVREALVDLIDTEPGLVVVGTAQDAVGAIAAITALVPDVALLDARLTEGSGMDVARHLGAHQPQTRCIILTSHNDDDAYLAYRLSGAWTYLIKEFSGDDLLDGIRAAAGAAVGAVDGSPLAGTGLASALTGRSFRLTTAERALLHHVVLGETNVEIADQLGEPEDLVRGLLSSIFSQLGLGGPGSRDPASTRDPFSTAGPGPGR
jgi:two-component system response regulator DevR